MNANFLGVYRSQSSLRDFGICGELTQHGSSTLCVSKFESVFLC